jgi:SHAQKYF class myb-like DNA-binding protein
LIGLYYWS